MASTTEQVATMHSLERTSPMGGPFVGVCQLCGKEGLTLAAMNEECLNAARITQGDALLAALTPPTGEPRA